MFQKIFTLTAISFLLAPTLSHAIEYQSPRTLGLGGSGRATPLLGDSIYLNPSYASYAPIYSLSGGYSFLDPQARTYNVSVQDSRTEIFQAGVGYTKREDSSAVNIGASRIAIERLAVGIGSKFIINNQTRKMTADFIYSTSYIGLFETVYTSFVIDNLLNNFSRTFYLGLKYNPTKNVNVFLDPFYSPTYNLGKKAGFHLGVELGLLADFAFRIGKFQNGEIPSLNTRGDGFGLGLGWMGPRISLDYAFARATQTDRGDSLTTIHSFATTVFF